MARTCFVISPIGPEGSAVREHADDVFSFIVQPAMEACGIEAFRSDHLREPGRISEQMFRAILGADLCIAVLTGYNPNVFYELAVAQAFERPVIVLIEKGQALPFDIHDLRCVPYDFRPRALFERVYVDEIVAHVRAVETGGWRVGSPFGALRPGGLGSAAPSVTLVERSLRFGDPDAWLGLITGTERALDLMGFTLSSWRRRRGFAESVLAKASAGCTVRIAILDADHRALAELVNDRLPGSSYDYVRHSIETMSAFFSDLGRQSPSIQFRQLRRGCPHGQITRTDATAVYIQHLYAERSPDSPLWRCDSASPLYDLVVREFASLWDANGT